MAIVSASLACLPQIQAEESLRAATVVGVGGGTIEKDERARIAREWSRTAYPDQVVVRRKPTRVDLQNMGIGVRRMKRG